MKWPMKFFLTLGLSLLLLMPSNPTWAQLPDQTAHTIIGANDSNVSTVSASFSNAKAPDVIWENEYSIKIMASQLPLGSYTGPNGVTINSYSSKYSSSEQLKKVYTELTNNALGSEVTYLSHIDLYPDYPYGNGIAGRWYGLWKNNTLASDRYIELYGVDSLSFTELAHTLSHEYGHHFTHYYLNLKEGTRSDFTGSGYAKRRELSSFSETANGSHEWAPEEIAAEDYAQLFGSPTWKKGLDYQDVRDVALDPSGTGNQTRRISSLENFNVQPQENTHLPFAWDVPGLYSYWVNLSGVNGNKNNIPPSRPYLTLSQVEGKTLTVTWTPSTDDLTKDIRYTVVYTNSAYPESPMGLRTTTESKGLDAVIGSYRSSLTTYSDHVLSGKTTLWVNAQDDAGNIVRSNLLVIDENNPQASLSPLPNRISGSDRYKTSVELSKAGWPNGSQYAVLVTGNDFPDALSAAPLARKYNAPILLTDSELNPQVENELARLNTAQVIIVGGTGVVTKNVEDSLHRKNIMTKRIFGSDRYTTALAVAQELGDFNEVFIATGENFPDALSAAPIAASLGLPILLTNKGQLTESLQTFLKERQISKSYVLGGTGVIGENVFSKLPNPERISGSSRYETNTAILNFFKEDLNYETTYVATGSNFPDALSGSVLAALTKSPILLTEQGSTLPGKTLIRQHQGEIKNYAIIGGEGALSYDIIAELLN